MNRAISALAMLAAVSAILSGAPSELSIYRDSAGKPQRLDVQGAPAGIRLQLVDGVNPMGVVVVDRSGGAYFAIDSLSSGPHTIRALEWGTGNGFGEALHFAVPGQPANSFVSIGTYATGSQPAVVQSGDFDGDGFPDLILGGADEVALMRNKGGLFGPSLPLAAITAPTGIAVGDFNGDGRKDVAIAAADGRVGIYLNKDGGAFVLSGYVTVGAHPSGMIAADFNGDGIPDLATSNQDDNSVSILLGVGDGTFQRATTIPAGNSPRAISVADFNGDGVPDLATANFGSDDVSILLGTGNGTFRTAGVFAAGKGPVRLATADFNEDGAPDLAVLNQIDGSVSLLLDDGAGAFRSGASIPNVSSLAAGDINGDGHADLVLQIDNRILVQLGRGDGTFAQGFNAPTVSPPLLLALDDFNGDGRLDLAAVDPSGVLTVLSGAGTGLGAAVGTGSGTGGIQSTALGSAVSVARAMAGSDPSAAALSAVPSSALFGQPVTLTATITPAGATGKVTFYDGTAILGSAPVAGGTATLVTIGIGYATRSLTARYIGDANYAPALSAPITEHITTNPGGGFNFAGYVHLGSQIDVQAMAVADLNHDGYPDIAAEIFNDGTVGAASVNVLLNKGDGTFQSPAPYLAGTDSIHIAIADLDLDGNPDLVVTTTSGVVWLKGNTDGTFQGPSTIFSSTDLSIVRIADLNSDGFPDVIVSHTATPTIEVRLGNGDGTFQTAVPATASVTSTIADLAVGDFNGDGIVDLAVTILNSVNVLAGVGDGTFLPPVSYQTNAGSIAVADVNHDGYLDIITGNSSPNVLLGKGNGTFQPPAYVPLNPPPISTDLNALAITDIDGDGNPDILGGAGGTLSIFFGNGDGTFRAPVGQFLFSTALLALADFNRDGLIDVADTDSGGVPISIYLGALSPRLTLTASPNPANVGQNVVLTVNSSFADVTGSISFTDDLMGISVGSAPFNNGPATFLINDAPRGNHIYQATYNGDSKYAATAAPLISVLVQQTIGISLSASPNPALPGQPVTLTATLTANAGNGDIIFLDGATPLDFQTLYSNKATFTTTLSAGVHQLRVVFPAYQGYEYASATYTETVTPLGGGQLIQGESYFAGTSPSAMAAADFTGDGLTDVAVADSTGQTLTLFAGTGLGKFLTDGSTILSFVPGAMTAVQQETNIGPEVALTDPANNAVHTFFYASGSFSESGTFSVGTQPVAISAADFDGDGIPDLVTANAGSNNASLLLSSKPAITLKAGAHPDALVVGDFNGDGNADFAVANRDDDTVSVFLGNRGGTFQTPAPTPAGTGPVAMAAGDFNGDGKTDLAIVDGGSGQITILLGNGNGTFKALPPISAPGASVIVVTQLTASGNSDLAVTTSSGLMVYPGNGDGTFQPPVNYTQYAGGAAILAAPFVLDGRMSLVIAVPATNSVSLLLNEVPSTTVLAVTPPQGVRGGEITFTISVTPSTAAGWFTVYDGTALVGSGPVYQGQGAYSTSLVLPGAHSFSARFDGVGFGPSSAAAVAYTVASVATTGLASPFTQNLVNSPVNLVPGDFNNDGIEDFAFLRSGNGLIVLLGNGNGTYREQSSGAAGGAPAVAADFNRDGFTDLAYSPIYPLVALGNGTGGFYEGQLNLPEVMPSALAAADVDGDTIPDLILANPNGTVDVLPGIGDGTFQTARIYPAGANPTALAIADLNEDGIPDIVVASNTSSSAGELNVLLGTGGGNFANPQPLDVGATPVSMALGDFNGDHHTDVALLHAGSNMITLVPGKGDGTFSPPGTIALPSSPAKILAADMNSDGIPDLIVMFTTGSPALAVLYGNGDGTFQSPTTFQDARLPIDFAVGDVNNDGRMDVVIASQSASFTAYGVDVFLGAAQALSILQGSGQTAGIGTAFSTTLQVHAVPNTAVTFSAPLSGPGGSFGASTSVSVTTDSSGKASAPAFTANSQAGTYTVTASAAKFVSVSFGLTNGPGLPASVGATLSQEIGQYTGINTAFSSPLQAIVLDAGNNPVPNITVTFTAPTSGASAVFPGGVSTATSVTNAAGIATSPLLAANGTTGSYMVFATVSGVTAPGYFELTNWPIGQFVVTDSINTAGSITTGSSAVTYLVDGISYSGTHIFNWTPGDTHTLSIGPSQTNVPLNYAFTGWSDGGAATHVYTVPVGATTITANFKAQYELVVSQATGGTITPATRYFDPGSPITVTATADPGYAFTGFTGGGSAPVATNNPTINSISFNLNVPSSISGYFTPLSQVLSATVSHTGSFTQGQTGATYSILVSNGISAAATGFAKVTATEVVPSGLTLISMAGAGWNCSANTCARFDSLAAGASYPAITATVNVASNAPSQVTNEVTVGGVASSDVTAIASLLAAQTITFGPLSGQALGSSPPPLSANASSGLPVMFVSNTTAVCTVSGVNLTLVAVGTCSITASQPGSTLYVAATTATQSFQVTPASLAFGQAATQSSSYGNEYASLAVDGNTDGNFSDGSVSTTNNDVNAWWQVDLEASAKVNSVVVWNRTDCCGSRLSDYWVFVSDTPFLSSDTPATLSGRAGTFSSHQTTAPSPSSNIVISGAEGRYVRVQLSGTGYLSLAEVQVFGTLVPLTDVALGQTATQSSTYGNEYASLAVDGNTDGNFGDGSVSTTNMDSNAWWQVDLGAPAAVSTIAIWNRTDCCGSRLSDYWVFVSNTPFLASDTPATLSGRAGTFSSHQTSAPSPNANIAIGVQGRYVRVQLSSPGYLSLAEVQVLATIGDLALGEAATQSSTYGSSTASLAVDGNTDGNFSDGSVSTTNMDANSWWQVDLGASAGVSSIAIWNRTDCCGSRLSDYWVFVSNTPFLSSDTPATLSGRAGTFSSHQTSVPSPNTYIAIGAQGRYVRVQLSSPGYLSLAEVQVFGTIGNVAQGQVATQSSTYGAETASLAIDGNTDGNFGDGSVSTTNGDVNAWWQVDLGASATMNSIMVWNRTDCCGSRLGDYWVFVSDTPFLPSDTPATLSGRPGTFSSHQTAAPSPSSRVLINGAEGRYVRVQLSDTDYLSLAEVQVFGTLVPPTDVASGQVAAQSSTYGSANASLATDRNTDGYFYDNSVSTTNLDTNAWWEVDLGVPVTVSSVVVWNRTDCCGSRLSDYWVFVSDTPFLSSDTPATLSGRVGTFSSHQTTAPSPSANIAIGVQGRYVRVQLSNPGYLSLAEVQVFSP